MRKYFNYARSESEFNDVVDAALELARATYEGNKPADYTEKNRILLENMGKLGVKETRYESRFETEGLNLYKNPNVGKNSTVRENFDAVLAQVITCIVPEVVNDAFEAYIAEVHQVGFGETARFVIESNDLFKVNSKAEGVRKGVDQPMFNDEITVNAHPVTIDTAIDWYPFSSGVLDMGAWAIKIARSFAGYIFIKAVAGMTQASTAFGPAYTINGVNPQDWAVLHDRVSAANGGMNVLAIGTVAALSNVSLGGNFQVQIGEEMNKVGYLDQYLGTPLLALKNVLVPGTTNGSAKLVLDDKTIYMIPVGGSRPVKILFEGNEISVSYNPETTSDVRYGISVELRVGLAAICGPKYGTVKLA